MMERRTTRTVTVGQLKIGGGHPIVIQSMTNTDTRNVQATLEQIQGLAEAGCEMVRCAVPDAEAAAALEEICKHSPLPVAADIHFDHRLALAALRAGAAKLRLNPGNIGSEAKVREVVAAAADRNVPIRIGVNAGSLPRWAKERYGRSGRSLVEAALAHVRILESLRFENIVISLKASSIPLTFDAYSLLSTQVDYPLHLGITEAGTTWFGTIKSAAGLGAILAQGIGDTIRISLTAPPVEEVKAAWALLTAMELRQRGPVIISCPTCGRTEIPLQQMAEEVEQRLQNLDLPITVAVMGCAVNGPGEASDADFGIAGGRGEGLVFRHGRIIRKVPAPQLVNALLEEIQHEYPDMRCDHGITNDHKPSES